MLIRKAEFKDAAGIANVHISSWRTTYRDVVSESYLANMDLEERVKRWQRILADGQSSTIVAVDGQGTIVGFANGGQERSQKYDYDGELYAIYLLEEYQRQGIGRKLVYQLAKAFESNGFTQMLVWVLAENPSRQFYESLGPTYIDEKTMIIGGDEFVEIAYGWADIASLCGKLIEK